jgi:hypothetical protein
MTVRQLLASLDSSELTEWMAFDSLETIGEARAQICAGIVAATTANHGSRTLPKPYKASDFMPFLKQPEEKPILLDDKEKQSALIMKLAFKRGK